ncbi:MAG TPA: hypothetical protein VNL94_04870 [Candidatus Binatia bacterium]|nr:hypothetical protein [Candidatus Binatia bacterium]
MSQVEDGDLDQAAGDADEAAEPIAAASRSTDARPAREQKAPAKPQPPARPSFGSAFREAYHPANVREDVAALPRLVRHWSFWLPMVSIVVGAILSTVYWNFTGGRLAFQLLVLPGSGFGLPQLVAGFFAPRASYLLGLLVSIFQGLVGVIFAINLANSTGTPITSDQWPGVLTQAFLAGPLSGMLFAAAAAWYRRFLNLSSPRRAAAARQQAARQPQRSRRPAGR